MILEPTVPVEIETRKNIFISQSRAGKRKTVTKSGAVRYYTLEFKFRDQDEYLAVLADYTTNYPGTAFSWVNTDLGASGNHFYNSELKAVVDNPDTFTYSIEVRAESALVPTNPGTLIFPYRPNFAYDITNLRKVLISDSVAQARIARSTSDIARQFQYTFKNRTLAELQAAENFWAYHYPQAEISFDDEVFDEDMTFFFDSNFKWTLNGVNLIDYTFVFTEILNTPSAPTGSVPTDPDNLVATAISSERIDLSWDDNSSSENGFSIERCVGAGCTSFAEAVTVPHNQSTYSDTGLNEETTYRYRVRAFNSAGYSGYTNVDEATTLVSNDFDRTNMLWRYRARSITGLTNLDEITTWPDISGNGRDLSSAGDPDKAEWHTGIINGKPAVYFGGQSVSHAFDGPNISGLSLTELDLYIVLKTDADPAALAPNGLWTLNTPTYANAHTQYPTTGGVIKMTACLPSGQASLDVDPTPSLASWHLLRVTAKTGTNNYVMYLDGTAIATGTRTSLVFPSTTTLGSASDNGGTAYYKGYIAEYFAFSLKSGTVQYEGIKSYMLSEYGLTVA